MGIRRQHQRLTLHADRLLVNSGPTSRSTAASEIIGVRIAGERAGRGAGR
jgi:hypothetical protein